MAITPPRSEFTASCSTKATLFSQNFPAAATRNTSNKAETSNHESDQSLRLISAGKSPADPCTWLRPQGTALLSEGRAQDLSDRSGLAHRLIRQRTDDCRSGGYGSRRRRADLRCPELRLSAGHRRRRGQSLAPGRYQR